MIDYVELSGHDLEDALDADAVLAVLVVAGLCSPKNKFQRDKVTNEKLK